MNKNDMPELEDDFEMLPEYDLSKMRIVRRGPGYQRPHAARMVRVTLDPDIAEVFNSDQSVNEALRTLLRALAATQPASQ